MEEDETYCYHCKKNTTILEDTSHGILKCSNCGLVLEEGLIDKTKEWREFADGSSSGGDPRRIGGVRNENLADGGLSLSVSGNEFTDSNRLMQMGNRLGGSAENRSIIRGHQQIARWGNLLNLNKKIILAAEELFTKIEASKKSLKGRSIESVAAACIYIASRQNSLPLKPQDIEGATSVNIKDIKGAYKAVKELADYIPPLDPPRYCSTFCKKLGMDPEVSAAAINIAQNIKEQRLQDGKNPRTIASASIYIATQLTKDCNTNLKDISSVSKIAENTIKNSYKEVLSRKNDIIPEWQGRLPIDSLHN